MAPITVGKNHRLLILLLVLLGVSLRFFYLAYPINRSSGISVDEAVFGIQAERIMNGNRPVFYPAQDYTGSFSAYISAVIFSIFGVSTWGLKLVPFLFSIGTILLIYFLALKIFNQSVALFALLVSALGTPFWNNWSSRAGTGYVEVTFIGILILLLTISLAKHTVINFRFIICSLILGFLAGLGFWVQPTVVYFIIPSLVYLLLNLRKKFFILFILFCLGFAVGGFPVIYYNIFVRHAGTTGALLKKPWGMRGALFKLVLEGFPVLLGGRTSNSTKDFNLFTSLFLYLSFTVSILYYLKIISGLRSFKRPEFLVFLTLVSTIAIFLVSTPFNQFSIEPRYVFSLYSLIPIIIGLFLSRLYYYSKLAGGLVTALYLLSFVVGLTQAGPLSFLDTYSFRPLVEFFQNRNIHYIVSTPSLGHRVMFFSGGTIKAGIRGGGITEARFEDINLEVGRALSLEPRLSAYATLNSETALDGFKIEAKSQYLEGYKEDSIGNYFRVIYSDK